MIRHLPPPHLRRLPHTVAPLHHESWGSYVNRLALANRIAHLELHEHINSRHRIHPAPLPLLDAIRSLSGHPRDRLLKALPDLRTPDLARHLPAACQPLDRGWRLQAACTLCLASKGVFTEARCWITQSTRLCLRHGRWTDTHGQQIDIRPLPEISQAQHDHHRLVRQHGWQTVEIAMREATDWCSNWWNGRRFHHRRDRRAQALSAPGWSHYRDDPRLIASGYPNIVALAGLLASPTLRSLPFTGNTGDFRRFIKEVRDRVALGYRYEGAGAADPLVRWIEEERYYRTLSDHPWPQPDEPRANNSKKPNELPRRATMLTSDDRSHCANCGNELKARNSRTRFCSTACRSRNWRLEQHQRALSDPSSSMQKVECPACGVTWTSGNDRRQDARYCSARCRQAAYRQRTALHDDY